MSSLVYVLYFMILKKSTKRCLTPFIISEKDLKYFSKIKKSKDSLCCQGSGGVGRSVVGGCKLVHPL